MVSFFVFLVTSDMLSDVIECQGLRPETIIRGCKPLPQYPLDCKSKGTKEDLSSCISPLRFPLSPYLIPLPSPGAGWAGICGT